MRTLIYARYSSQLQNSRSIDQQIEVCRERAERERWDVVDIYTDYAIGGGAGTGEAQRPGLAAMLDRIAQGDIDQVLVDTTSRIARNQGDGHHIRDRINFHGARLYTLGDGEIDRFKGAIKGLVDEQQRIELRHNIKRGQAGTVRQGRAPAGLAYGYRTANRIDEAGRPVRGLREIDPDQAEIVRRIFRDYAAGKSPVAIARELNAEQIPGPRGREWRASSIRSDGKRGNGLLANRIYIGQRVHNRTSKVIEPVTRTTRIRPNPESDWIVHEVPELRIVDQHLWDTVAEAIEGNRTTRPHAARRARHVLSGLGVCGVCGGPWNVKTYKFWGCGARGDGSTCSNNRTISTERYEQLVFAGLQDSLLDPALVSVYVKEYHEEYARRATQGRRRRAALERGLREAEAKIARLVSAVAEGGDEFAEIRDALRNARAARDRARNEIADIEALQVVALHPAIADRYREQVADLHAALAEPETRLAAAPVLRNLIDRIVLTPNPDGRSVVLRVEGKLRNLVGLAEPDAQRRHIL